MRPDPIGRRAWLASVLALGLTPKARAADVDADAEAIERQANKAGLRAFRSAESRHYRALGDAPESYLRRVLRDCEAVAADFFAYYPAEGFAVTLPERRLTAVVFADVRSYAAFQGTRPDLDDGGRYDRASNRLYVYDYRADGLSVRFRPGYFNLVALAHEATHQLAFSCGPLDRQADVPRSISEGLAEQAETRRFDAPSPPGQLNEVRLTDIARKQRQGAAWIPLPRLLADDRLLNGSTGPEATILAYGQSWLLVYHLLKDPVLLPGFRNYLAAIRVRRDPSRRLDDARAHLGDLDRLDRDLRALSIRLLKTN